jgi:Carboxypeptidase regulatory-like domain
MKTKKSNGRRRGVLNGLVTGRGDRNSHPPQRFKDSRTLIALWLGVLVLCPSISVAKQKPPATKTISGQVLNGSSQGISGASVLLTDLQTHKTNAIYSGSGGNYNFSGLNAYHDYEVEARYHGMTSETREVSSMDPRLQIVVNLTLGPESSSGQ